MEHINRQRHGSPVGCTLHGDICVGDYMCILEIGFLYQGVFLLMHVDFMASKKNSNPETVGRRQN